MKTTILIVAAAAMSAAALQAQMPKLTADVPFAFYKGDTQMPAGRYVVKPATHALPCASMATREAESYALPPMRVT